MHLLFLSPDWLTFCHVIISYKLTRFFIYFPFLYDEGPMLETLDHTIRIGSTPTFLYFDLYIYIYTCIYTLKTLWLNNPGYFKLTRFESKTIPLTNLPG